MVSMVLSLSVVRTLCYYELALFPFLPSADALSTALSSPYRKDGRIVQITTYFGVGGRSLQRQHLQYRVAMSNNNEEFPAVSSESKIILTNTSAVEGSCFGVTEKNMELKNLIEAQNAVDKPKLEQIVGEEQGKAAVTTTETAIAPSLAPMAILHFIAPTLALWIAPPVMSLIDTSAVGRFCGPTDLAALSPGCTLIDSSAYLFMFIATAATNMVASARADGDDTVSDRVVGEALFLALCSGIFLAGIVLIAGQPILMGIAGQESASVVPSALKYATIRAFGQPFVVMASVARATALASKDTRGPLLSVAFAFVLNTIGTVVLVRGTGLGIMGAAIGTLCADIAATLFLLNRIRPSKKEKKIDKDTSKQAPLFAIPTMRSFLDFSQYAAPIFFTLLGKQVVYNGVTISVGRLGSVALAAHQVLLRSFFFWTPVGDSIGMTSQVFLPGILAKERKTGVPQKGAKRLLFGIGVVSGLVAATLAGLLPSMGAGLFTNDVHVAAALRQTAPILALGVSMHATALTCEGMLLALRDLKFLSSSYVVTTIATAALLLSPFRPSTLAGSWWILALFQGSRALQFAFRTQRLSRKPIVQESYL